MYNWVNHHIQSGFEYYQQKQTSNQYAISYPPAELDNLSGWLVNDMTLHQLPLTLSIGTRFTQYRASRNNFPENKHINLSSRMAVSITPTHWLNLYHHTLKKNIINSLMYVQLYNNSNHFTIPFFGTPSNFLVHRLIYVQNSIEPSTGIKISFDGGIYS
ncbi:hypothetical protein AB6E88_08930 [Providencia hangzhouensis]